MIISINIGGRIYQIDDEKPIDLSIPLKFNGPQPKAYGVSPATSSACEAGSIIGDTRRGGSCNFESYTFIPHCNGTHTECVGHITDERISVRDCLKDVFIPAMLVSIMPDGNEPVMTKESLIGALADARATDKQATDMFDALIVRTLPNDDSKLTREYLDEIPPYVSTEAMEYIAGLGVKHLLVDMPSIDRIYDEGRLTNHRIFWNVKPGSKEVTAETRINSTISELIYVPGEIEDGEYLLNLQIAPFESDASPSRPIIFRSER